MQTKSTINPQQDGAKKYRRGLAIIIFLVVAIVLCIGAMQGIVRGYEFLAKTISNSSHHMTAARTAVTRFHEQLTAGRYAEIYAQAAPELKQTISEAEWIAKMDDLMRRTTPIHGVARAGDTEIINGKIHYRAFDGVYVILKCKTQYAFVPNDETFVFLVRSEQPQLYSYHNSFFDILEQINEGKGEALDLQDAIKKGKISVEYVSRSPTPNRR